jgi:hypothetical protein
MNLKTRIVGLVAGVGLVAFLGASASEAGPAAAVGPKATFVKGDVQAGEGDTLKKVRRGQVIAAGANVKTGEGARAELTFPDGSVVRLGPGSVLKLEGVAFNGKSKEVKVQAELVGGQAWAKVANLVGKDAQFQVKTQNAVAGVRGTVFRVNVDEDEATVVKVYNGSVAVGGGAPFLSSSEDDGCKDNPIKCNRKEIAAPFQQVTKEQFEHLLGKMMQITVTKDGVKAATPTAFTAEEDAAGEPEWVRWNNARDAGKDKEKSD